MRLPIIIGRQGTTTQLYRNHHPPVIFRCDDSVDHHRAVVSGATTQPATIIATLDLSGTTTQPTDHNVQRNSALRGIRLKIPRRNTTGSARKLKYKAAKEQKNTWPTIAKINELCNYFTFLIFVDSHLQTGTNQKSRGDKLSSTNLAPNYGINRRQSTEIGF
ncbi:hypothetical protein F511_08936 [Dorcoceras hygrometricum]|uniref:Uncharacterized protein n=1 Tax=Dorcoceras hygrometricum TaxID=472368 RepID=A0A2Z7A9W9_9LAMI|nr:hypothetical protein F511_08936 [Dorcoceras hygrometricum]